MQRSVSRPVLRAALASAAISVVILVAASTAFGHAVVYPLASMPGAYERYVLRVPNERDVPTVQVEIRFPKTVRVVSFSDVPGWNLRTVTDSARNITGAVWTGVLPPERFVEFPFVGVNPKEPTTIVWPTIQTYEGGIVVEWTGADGSNTPASVTSIGDAGTAASTSRTPLYLAALALMLSIVALALGLRRVV